MLEYREQLQQSHHARTVNAKLSAIHSYLDYLGLAACKVRFLKIQHTVFVDDSRDLTEAEYHRLLDAAKRKKDSRLYHVMLAICTTGIRVSELSFLTVEALHKGKAEIRMKGKIRTILLTKELCRKLNAYAKEKGIRTGYLFCTRTGKPLDRSNICHDMKKLCRAEIIMKYRELLLNPATMEVSKNGQRLTLTKTEFELLHCFLGNLKTVLSREWLLNHVWGMDFEGDSRTVDTNIRRLRKKIGEDYIRTRVGMGYVMGEENA